MSDVSTVGTEFVLTAHCPDQPGIVFAVSEVILAAGCTIVDFQQHVDERAGTFYMRAQFRSATGTPLDVEEVRAAFAPTADKLGATWRLNDAAYRSKVLIMVSRYGHCLNDLLYRTRDGRLSIDPVGVVSNHPDLVGLAAHYGVPFHHIPVNGSNKEVAEARLLELVDELDVDLVVLARYMQILSPELCHELSGRAINIHHSMLPSFKGARPYHQAYERGVKLVGATAHYVTEDLDEGPIIEQDVARVNHALSADQFTALGRDTEAAVLSRAVGWHADNRVLLDGRRTIVFP